MRSIALVLVLALALLGGCLKPDAGDGTGSSGGGGPATPPVVTDEEAVRAFENAFASFEAPTDATRRFAMTGSGVAQNSTEPASLEFALLFDVATNVVVMSMEMEGAALGEGAAMPFGAPGEAFLVGQVAKTTFFGSESALIASYNESEEPVDSIGDFEATPGGEDEEDADDSDFDPSDPSSFLGAMNVDASAVTSARGTVYKGKPAVEITFSNTTEDGQTVTATAIVFVNPDLPARVEANIRDPAAEEPLERDARIVVEFAYGADATHKFEEALVRAETMTLLNAESMAESPMFGGGDGETTRTYTVQPSAKPGLVPLSEVEAVVKGTGEGATALLTMPLEASTAENEHAKVVFVDRDANGKVSPGDTITVTKKSDDAREATLLLHDEKTGLFVAPGPALALALALVAALALAGRRR